MSFSIIGDNMKKIVKINVIFIFLHVIAFFGVVFLIKGNLSLEKVKLNLIFIEYWRYDDHIKSFFNFNTIILIVQVVYNLRYIIRKKKN